VTSYRYRSREKKLCLYGLSDILCVVLSGSCERRPRLTDETPQEKGGAAAYTIHVRTDPPENFGPAGTKLPPSNVGTRMTMWRHTTRLLRQFCGMRIVLKENTTYLEKLAARKPLPILREIDLEETFVRG
jgi:hypothetical protein